MPDNGRSLLILDLDETLVSARSTGPHAGPGVLWPTYDFKLDYVTNRSSRTEITVRVRPGVAEFLLAARGLFDDVAVWTASSGDYAAEIVRHVFPSSYPLAFLWASDRCSRHFDQELRQEIEGTKNLSKVRREGWPISRMLIVDDDAWKLFRQPTSLVQIAPWDGLDQSDVELARVLRALEAAVKCEDFRHWRRALGDDRAAIDRYPAPKWYYSASRDRKLPRRGGD